MSAGHALRTCGGRAWRGQEAAREGRGRVCTRAHGGARRSYPAAHRPLRPSRTPSTPLPSHTHTHTHTHTLTTHLSHPSHPACRVWDVRTKVQAHCLSGHEDTVAAILAQPTDPQASVCVCRRGGGGGGGGPPPPPPHPPPPPPPTHTRSHLRAPCAQVITASYDKTIRLWDLRTGKTLSTLTYHKKARAVHAVCTLCARAAGPVPWRPPRAGAPLSPRPPPHAREHTPSRACPPPTTTPTPTPPPTGRARAGCPPHRVCVCLWRRRQCQKVQAAKGRLFAQHAPATAGGWVGVLQWWVGGWQWVGGGRVGGGCRGSAHACARASIRP